MLKKFSLALLFASAALASTAQKISVQKGQKIETVMTSKMNMTMEMMGQSIDNSTETVNTTLLEVKDVTPNSIVFASTLSRMVMNANAMGQEVKYDSDKKEDSEGQMGQAFKNLIGKTSEFTVSGEGKITEVVLPGDQEVGMSEMMNVVGMSKGQSFPVVLPIVGRPLKAGDTWVDSAGTSNSIKTVTTYTVKSVSGNDVTVTSVGNLAKSGTIQQNGMDIEMNISGNFTGDGIYEKNTGVLKNNTMVMDLKGNMTVMGQEVPINMKNTMTTVATRK